MDTVSYLLQVESTGLADGLDVGKVERNQCLLLGFESKKLVYSGIIKRDGTDWNRNRWAQGKTMIFF